MGLYEREPSETPIKKVPYPDHPNRCQAVGGSHGDQCFNLAAPESKYCLAHSGNFAVAQTQLKELNLYRVKKYEKRIREFKEANGARGLEEELAIMRMVLEEILLKCENEGEMGLLLYSTKISETVRDIKTLVLSVERLSSKAGLTIGRSQGVVLAGKVVDIISRHVTDMEALNRIANDIGEAFVMPDPENAE